MQISNNLCRPVNAQPAFKSKLMPTKDLERGFDFLDQYWGRTNKRPFINAIKCILNDRKKDVISITKEGKEIFISVNGETYKGSRRFTDYNREANGVIEAVIDFARREKGYKHIYPQYDYLYPDELKAIKTVFNKFKELDPKDTNLFLKSNHLLDRMEKNLKRHTIHEIARIRKLIFKDTNH